MLEGLVLKVVRLEDLEGGSLKDARTHLVLKVVRLEDLEGGPRGSSKDPRGFSPLGCEARGQDPRGCSHTW